MALRVKSVGGMRDEECGGTDSEPFCRICLGGSDEMECGDLLTPCNCSGSLKHVHTKCFDTWTKNGPTLPEAGPILSTVLGILAFTGYYWLCMRIRCELCGSIYRVKRVRLHWLMRWMVFLILLSALVITCGLFIRTGPATLFRTSYKQQANTTDKVEFSMAQAHAKGTGYGDSEAPRLICFIPKYRRWLYCFEAAEDLTLLKKTMRSWLVPPRI